MKLHDILDEIASYDHFLSQATSKLVFAEAAPELTSKQFETLKKYRADLAKKYKPVLEGYMLMTEQELEIKELREKIAVLESKSLNHHLEWKPYDHGYYRGTYGSLQDLIGQNAAKQGPSGILRGVNE